MIRTTRQRLINAPTPMAGLALGVASLAVCWESYIDLGGYVLWAGTGIAVLLLVILSCKFLAHRHLLRDDLAHPVVGSVVPTFAMGTMVVSHALGLQWPMVGDGLWLFAIGLHIVFLASFAYHRSRDFQLDHMVPSWFVPPVGIVVGAVSFSGNPNLYGIAIAILYFGMFAYCLMLPAMIYRFVFRPEVPDTAKPTIAILAAPASLVLAGYLTVIEQPSPVVISLFSGIAVLMTTVIYLAFCRLLRLPFSPGYAAFTFPMVIGATALFKVSVWMQAGGMDAIYVKQVYTLACVELLIATLVVFYVLTRFGYHLLWVPVREKVQAAGAQEGEPKGPPDA